MERRRVVREHPIGVDSETRNPDALTAVVICRGSETSKLGTSLVP